ncbi:hypothetical protein ACFWDQ_29890 [Streptomyces sp. NPDC060053]|uniref:hypothetical protein n=1 Tax=Streptomyces sp. NPDC060053 TaxID=3347047 RepID=UPI00369DC495
MTMTTAEADKILPVDPAPRAPAPGWFVEVADAHADSEFALVTEAGAGGWGPPGAGADGGHGPGCRGRRVGRPWAARKKEDDVPADFVPARGDRFGCPEPSGPDEDGPSKAVADLCAGYVLPGTALVDRYIP